MIEEEIVDVIFTWIGPPAGTDQLSVGHDSLGPVLSTKSGCRNVRYIFYCLDEYEDHYNKRFKNYNIIVRPIRKKIEEYGSLMTSPLELIDLLLNWRDEFENVPFIFGEKLNKEQMERFTDSQARVTIKELLQLFMIANGESGYFVDTNVILDANGTLPVPHRVTLPMVENQTRDGCNDIWLIGIPKDADHKGFREAYEEYYDLIDMAYAACSSGGHYRVEPQPFFRVQDLIVSEIVRIFSELCQDQMVVYPAAMKNCLYSTRDPLFSKIYTNSHRPHHYGENTPNLFFLLADFQSRYKPIIEHYLECGFDPEMQSIGLILLGDVYEYSCLVPLVEAVKYDRPWVLNAMLSHSNDPQRLLTKTFSESNLLSARDSSCDSTLYEIASKKKNMCTFVLLELQVRYLDPKNKDYLSAYQDFTRIREVFQLVYEVSRDKLIEPYLRDPDILSFAKSILTLVVESDCGDQKGIPDSLPIKALRFFLSSQSLGSQVSAHQDIKLMVLNEFSTEKLRDTVVTKHARQTDKNEHDDMVEKEIKHDLPDIIHEGKLLIRKVSNSSLIDLPFHVYLVKEGRSEKLLYHAHVSEKKPNELTCYTVNSHGHLEKVGKISYYKKHLGQNSGLVAAKVTNLGSSMLFKQPRFEHRDVTNISTHFKI